MSFFPVRIKKSKSTGSVYDCSVCKLDKNCKTPVMKGSGNSEADIMIIGEAPMREEDRQGRPFLGKSGELLRNTLKKFKIKAEDCFITNSVRCRPEKNRTPTAKEIKCCFKFLQEDIKQVQPKIMVLLGGVACKAILNESAVSKYSGYQLLSTDYNCYIVPTYHPTKVLKDYEYKTIFENDLSKLKILKNKDLKLNDFTKGNTVLEEFDDVIDVLRSIRKDSLKFALDWETYPLRPYNEDSVIVSCGIAIGANESYTFLMEGNWSDEQWKELVFEFDELFNSDCPKVFFNYKFEKDWAVNRLGVDITGDIRDMMLVSYLEDSRKGTNNLEFQSFVNFGVGKIKEANKYKKDMRRCPTTLLHDYQGRDARLTFALEECKWIYMDTDDKQSKIYYDLLLPGTDTILDSEIEGVLVDKSVVKDIRGKLISKQTIAIKNLKDILKRNGIILTDIKDLNSPDQISKILFNVLKLKSIKKTAKGKNSVDKEVLEHYKKEPFCEFLLEYRGLAKLLSTYVDGLEDVLYDDGLLHPSFNLHLTGTGRLSGTNPNMQNIPKRKNRFIRGMFNAPKDHLIMSFDYSGAEVRGMAMESKDSTLIKYIKEKYDMHQFWADRIKELTGRETTRHEGKNSFVFPSFYGASYKSIAESLDIKEDISKQLQDELFKEFPGMKRWQVKVKKFYDKNGYVESLFGRKRYAPLSYNQIINTPIQSLAADFTLKSLIKSIKKGYRMCWTIHDDNSFYIPDDKVESSYNEIKDIMTNLDLPFINVPLEVDCSVGENWFDMVDINEILGD